MVTAIIAAAGKSERMGAGMDKAFLSLVNKPIVAWSLLAFERCVDVDQIVLVVRKDQLLAAKAVVKMFGISKIRKIVAGGKERRDSVMAALKEVDVDTRIVVVHDAARPCVTGDLISEVVKQARRSGAVAAGHHIWDTVKYVEKGTSISRTEDRTKLWAVQTPQAFNVNLLRKAYKKAVDDNVAVTDDAQAVEMLGEEVKIFETNAINLKITTVEDLRLAGKIVM